MSATVAQNNAEYPVYEGRMHYIDGYDPVSLYAPHSSLQRTSTWLGMGFLLASLAGLNWLVFGAASGTVGSQENASTYMIIGAVLAVVFIGLGAFLIHRGRRFYRAYREETGRVN